MPDILIFPAEKCRIGAEEQNEWYFFSHKDKKYPTGTRTNRATTAGFWKATGRDKPVYTRHSLIGMRKTLVFYQGRAPNGQKSDWIMHEYRLETNENASPLVSAFISIGILKDAFPQPLKSLSMLTWINPYFPPFKSSTAYTISGTGSISQTSRFSDES